MKRQALIIAFLGILSFKSYGQNSPFTIYGNGLNGSVYQMSAIYSDINGLNFEAPLNSSGIRLPIKFNWRGGGEPALFIAGDSKIGIGVKNPSSNLDLKLEQIGNNDFGCKGLILRKSRSLTVNDVNQISFSINDNGSHAQAIIRSITVDPGDGTGRLEFCTRQLKNSQYTGQALAWTPDLTINSGGFVGIGTNTPACKLDVIGTIRAREIKVDLNGADFVFEKDYKLMPLIELERFVKEQKHLPEVAPAKEMKETGTDLGNLNSKLLQKMEEMTLYMIEQNKAVEELKQVVKLQSEEIEKLKAVSK